MGVSRTRPAGKVLQTEVANVSCAGLICTLISLCHFCLQKCDLPGESEMIHLILINPPGITFIPSHFRFSSIFRQNAQALKDAQGPKNENSSEDSC